MTHRLPKILLTGVWALAALLAANPKPNDKDIDAAIEAHRRLGDPIEEAEALRVVASIHAATSGRVVFDGEVIDRAPRGGERST